MTARRAFTVASLAQEYGFSADAFAERVDRRGPDECWPWLGQKNHHGYGILMSRTKPRRNVRMTHIMLELYGRPRPHSALALHSCDNPGCVNPAHLRWGEAADNVRDRVARGRTRGPQGTKAASAKLTEEQVRYIRNSGAPGAELARELGVGETAISRVRHRKTWSHVP